MKKNKCVIYCNYSNCRGISDFYMSCNGEDYYLFSSRTTVKANAFFSNGVCLERALDKTFAGGDKTMLNIQERLPKWIRFIEKCEDIAVLDKTLRRDSRYESKYDKYCA